MGGSKSRRKSRVPRKKKTVFAFDDLTDELLHEILIRLPSGKEAVRCKLVCKRWFSLISSDYFLTTSVIHHHNNDDKTQLPFALLVAREQTIDYVEFHLHDEGLSRRTVDLGYIFAGQPDDRPSLEASCGDLVLLSTEPNYNDVYFYICNIVTREWIVLPPVPQPTTRFTDSIGLLYEPLDNDDRRYKYLVLRTIISGPNHYDVEIFSSVKGSWTKSSVGSSHILNWARSRTPVIACGRMFYMLNSTDWESVNCIVAFDPFTDDPDQILRVVDLPPEACDSFCLDSKLGVCRGRLQFAQVLPQQGRSRYPCISVWELEDYRTGKWTLVHRRIPKKQALRVPLLNDYIHPRNTVSVLDFHPYNEDLISFLVSNDIVVYNIRTDEAKSFTRDSRSMLHQDIPKMFLPYLLLPITQQWWPTPVLHPPAE